MLIFSHKHNQIIIVRRETSLETKNNKKKGETARKEIWGFFWGGKNANLKCTKI